MADKSAAPAAPAAPAAVLDGHAVIIEGFSRPISSLESDKQDLQREIDILRSKLAQQSNSASSARGSMKTMQDEIAALRNQLASSESLKELGQLRAEVAGLHKTIAHKDKAASEAATAASMKSADLTHRAGRAEAKFQALESTAAIMAKSRDKANEAAATLLAERDDALKAVAALTEDLAQFRAEFIKVKGDFDRAQAEAKALRQAPAAAVKAK